MMKLAGLVLLTVFFLTGCSNRNTVPTCGCPSDKGALKTHRDPFVPLD